MRRCANIFYLLVTVISGNLLARQISRIGQFLQGREKYFNRLHAHADNPHTKTKEIRQLIQSPSIVFADRISFSVQLINIHTFCLLCFIENDTVCKTLFLKKSLSRDLLSRRYRWKRENTL